jgi:hypothetical protein
MMTEESCSSRLQCSCGCCQLRSGHARSCMFTSSLLVVAAGTHGAAVGCGRVCRAQDREASRDAAAADSVMNKHPCDTALTHPRQHGSAGGVGSGCPWVSKA